MAEPATRAFRRAAPFSTEAPRSVDLKGFKDDVLTAKNYLAHLAFALHQRRQRFMASSEFESWHQGYCTRHKLRLRSSDMRSRLVDAQILQSLDDEIGFRHRFGYYLFVADYFARHMEEESTRAQVAEMFSKVFHEETANILVFLCFKATGHTEFVVKAMLDAARAVFAGETPAKLEEDAGEMGKLVLDSHGPALKSLSPDERRSEMLENKEVASEHNPYGSMREDDLGKEDEVESNYPPEVRATYAAVRTIQILGQILRNFYGTLGGAQKVEIAREIYELSMRVTGWYFRYISAHHKVIAATIARLISRNHHSVASDPDRLDDEVRQVLVSWTELVSFSMVKRAAEATGMRALEPVFNEVLMPTDGDAPSAAYRLIGLDLALNLSSSTPVGEIRAVARHLRDNPYAFRILQHLAHTYLHVNYVNAQVTQQICSELKIKLPTESFDSELKKLPRLE